MSASPVLSDLEDLDIGDHGLYLDGPPHELFARMRAEDPVRWNTMPGGEGFWSLTKSEDVVAVSRDSERFSTYRGGLWFTPDTLMPLDFMRNLMMVKDPPDHTRYRLIVQTVFTPHTVTKLESAIRGRVARLLDAMIAKGDADFVRDFAMPLPLGVIAELLGAPDEDMPVMLEMTDGIEVAIRSGGPEGGPTMQALFEYFMKLTAAGHESEKDTLVKRLSTAEVEGQSLTQEEITLFMALLVFAGNDTTRNALSGGMLALMENPEQLAWLRANPEQVPNAVEEVLRWTTPVNYFARTAARDTEIRGVKISEGDRLVMWYVSASRDEDVFPDPQRFDVSRVPAQHAAFGGGGRHFCLGAGLARLELKVAFEEILARVGACELTGALKFVPSSFVNSLTEMPVSVTGA